MYLLLRTALLGFIAIAVASFFFGSQTSQQIAVQQQYQKEVEAMRIESEQRSCKQFIKAKFCTAPQDRFERYLCSKNLADFHCGKYVDVGNRILEEHQKPSNRL